MRNRLDEARERGHVGGVIGVSEHARGATRRQLAPDPTGVPQQCAQRAPGPLPRQPHHALREALTQRSGPPRRLEERRARTEVRRQRQGDAGRRQRHQDLVRLLAPQPGDSLAREVAHVAEDHQVAGDRAADAVGVLAAARPDPVHATPEHRRQAVPLRLGRRRHLLAGAGLRELHGVGVTLRRERPGRLGAVRVGRERLQVRPIQRQPGLAADESHRRQQQGRARQAP